MPQTTATMPVDDFPDIQEAFNTFPELPDLCGAPCAVQPQTGLTNRVYRLETDKGTFFLRLPREETAGLVDRAAEANNIALAASLGLALPPLYCNSDAGILVTPAVTVVGSIPQDFPQSLGNTLGRLHVSGVKFSGVLDPNEVYRAQRESLKSLPEFEDEFEPLELTLQHHLAGSGHDVSSQELVPSHGDLSPGNCLVDQDRIWLIDWEYSGMSEPAWDIAYAIQENDFSVDQEQQFLGAYRGATGSRLFPAATRLELLKARCDAVSALWALEQVNKGRDPDVFLQFARERRDRALGTLQKLS